MTEKNLDRDLSGLFAKQMTEIDQLMREEQGLTPLLAAGFKGGMSKLMLFAYMLATMLALTIFYSGYRFFTANESEQLLWGVVLLLSFQAQVGTKLWIWQESQRVMLLRELKKIQVQLQREE